MTSLESGVADIRVEGNTIIADLTDWGGDPSAIESAESEWLDLANQAHVTAAIVEFSDDLSLPSETQRHITTQWSELTDSAAIEKSAYVSKGIEAMAVGANLDASAEVQTFDTLEEALDWTRN